MFSACAFYSEAQSREFCSTQISHAILLQLPLWHLKCLFSNHLAIIYGKKYIICAAKRKCNKLSNTNHVKMHRNAEIFVFYFGMCAFKNTTFCLFLPSLFNSFLFYFSIYFWTLFVVNISAYALFIYFVVVVAGWFSLFVCILFVVYFLFY